MGNASYRARTTEHRTDARLALAGNFIMGDILDGPVGYRSIDRMAGRRRWEDLDALRTAFAELDLRVAGMTFARILDRNALRRSRPPAK